MNVSEHLRALECELLTNTTRKNAARVASLLAESFREFGSSGRSYSKEEIILALRDEAPVSISLLHFEMNLLAPGGALVTYQSHKDQPGAPPVIALRSSVWVQDRDEWRMIFHQGTNVRS